MKGGGVLLVKLGEGDNLAALIAERLINKMQVRCCIFTIFVECNKMFGKIRKENISAFSKSQKYPRFQISVGIHQAFIKKIMMYKLFLVYKVKHIYKVKILL